jgi:hypothetical protein
VGGGYVRGRRGGHRLLALGAILVAFVAAASAVAAIASRGADHRYGAVAHVPGETPKAAPRKCPCSPGGTPIGAPTTVVTPVSFHPTYDRISQLYDDSEFVVLARIGREEPDTPLGPAETVGGYPLDLATATFLGGMPYRGQSLGIPVPLFRQLPLTVGRWYVLFLTSDRRTPLCVVGGRHGVFSYDRRDRTVHSVADVPGTQVPRTMSLAHLDALVSSAQAARESAAAATASARVQVVDRTPYCSPAATGLPGEDGT